MTPKRPATRLDFEIAIICALVIEADAVRSLFDRDWDDNGPPYDKAPRDPNAYSTGLLGRHNIVLAYMPGMGKANAATVASHCRTSFPNIRLALVVGVCGAVPIAPSTKNEIVLGDVIISSGVIQYDFGRQLPERFVRKDTLHDSLGRPPTEIRSLLAKLGGIHDRKKLRSKLASHLEELQKESELEAKYPGIAHDRLFDAKYRHISDGETCEDCGCSGKLIGRQRFHESIPQPFVHFGLIASGDTVMKCGEDRDKIALQEGVIGFEMEGAGAWDAFPCIVIKGACDYADSHKTKVWQRYAAATAAACTKAFLEYWVPSVTTSHDLHEYTLAFSLSEVAEVGQFVGRKDELAQIHGVLDKADGRRTAVLHGLGGIGKTQLAIAYLKAHHVNYSATIWLNASDIISLQQSFSRAAENILRQYPGLISIKTAMESRAPDDILRAVKGWLDEPKNNHWLLVFDNYDNPKLEKEEKSDNDEETSKHWSEEQPAQEATIASKAYDIRTFFPNTYHGAIIITTRSSTVRIGKSIFLKKFSKVNDSLEVLRSNSQRDDIENDEAAVELAQRLEGLPLALATAGAYLSQVSTSCAEYLKQYDESWLRLQKKTPGLLSYESRAMYSTWDISYEQVRRRNHQAAMMLHLWAYFDNEDLWYELLRYEGEEAPLWFKYIIQDHISFDEVMRVLCSHGLVEADQKRWGVDSGGYSVHECVHAWMKYALNSEQQASLAQLAMSCIASRIPSREQANFWLVQRRLLLHVDVCSSQLIELGQVDDADYGWIAHSVGYFYVDQGRHSEAEAMYDRALQGYEKAWGPEHILTLDIVNNLGLLYANQGRHSEAEAMYDRALQGKEKAWGPEHTSTLDTVNNLGLLYKDQGRHSEAEAMYNRALQGKEKAWGPEHTSTLDIVNNLGSLYASQGRQSEAEVMYDRALQGKEKAWGPEHTSTLNTVNNLGLLYKDQGRHSEAEAMYDRALQGKEKAWGPEHTSTLDIVNNLGSLYASQGRHSEAEAMYDRVLRGYEKAWGPEHALILNTVNNLGSLYAEQGRHSEAEVMYDRALQGKEKAWGPEHTSTLDIVNNLGNLYTGQGRHSEAEAMYDRALQGKEKAWGPEHTSTLDTVNNLGSLYASQGRHSEAEAMYNRALQGYEKAWGPEHTSTLDTVNNLGLLYASQGRHSEAEAMYDRALQGKEKAWGPEHTSTLDTVNNLGSLYAEQGRHSEAEAMYDRALQGYEKRLGNGVATYPPALTTLQNLGDLFYQLKRLEQAENYYVRAQSGLVMIYGHDSARCSEVSSMLAKVRHKERPRRRTRLVAKLIPNRWQRSNHGNTTRSE